MTVKNTLEKKLDNSIVLSKNQGNFSSSISVLSKSSGSGKELNWSVKNNLTFKTKCKNSG